jgi:hypothetical protein
MHRLTFVYFLKIRMSDILTMQVHKIKQIRRLYMAMFAHIYKYLKSGIQGVHALYKVSKMLSWKFNRLLCITNLASKQFNFYVGRKSCYRYLAFLWYLSNQGWIPHDLVGGGGALPAQVPSCVGHVCRPPIKLLHYCKVLLDFCIWIVSNCCSQFAYHQTCYYSNYCISFCL